MTGARVSPIGISSSEQVGLVDSSPAADVQGLKNVIFPYICNIGCYSFVIDFNFIIVFHVVNFLMMLTIYNAR